MNIYIARIHNDGCSIILNGKTIINTTNTVDAENLAKKLNRYEQDRDLLHETQSDLNLMSQSNRVLMRIAACKTDRCQELTEKLEAFVKAYESMPDYVIVSNNIHDAYNQANELMIQIKQESEFRDVEL